MTAAGRAAIILLPVLALAAHSTARAATPAEIFSKAGDAYEAGNYQEAAAGYARILDYGLRDPRVYYNLGNAYFKMGRLGAAILNYERALRLNPADREARDNLELARGQIRDRVAEPEVQYPLRVLLGLLDSVTADVVAALFLAFYIVAGGFLGALPLTRSSVARRGLAYGALASGIVAVVFGAGLFLKVREATAVRAIVMEDKVDVRSGPAEDNTVLFTVHEGTRLEVRNHLGGWYQVSLPNALSGWIPAVAVEKV